MNTWMDELGKDWRINIHRLEMEAGGIDQTFHFEHVKFKVSLRQASEYIK